MYLHRSQGYNTSCDLMQCDVLYSYKGFRLLNNHKCTDINECEEGIDECHVDGLCRNNIGSYTCNCQEGYKGIYYSYQ